MLLISRFSLNWRFAAFTVLALAATALSIHVERKFEKGISRISKIFWKWVISYSSNKIIFITDRQTRLNPAEL